MPQTALLNLGLNYDWDSADDGWKAGVDNNWALLDFLAKATAISTLNAEPGAPSPGDAYIIGSAATGTNWAGHSNEVTVWNAATGAWVFAVAKEGWQVYDISDGIYKWWDGLQWITVGRAFALAAGVTIGQGHMAGTIELDTTAATRAVTIVTDATDALPVGFNFWVINRSGANTVTFTLAGLTTRGIVTLTTDRQTLRIVKVAANTWISS